MSAKERKTKRSQAALDWGAWRYTTLGESVRVPACRTCMEPLVVVREYFVCPAGCNGLLPYGACGSDGLRDSLTSISLGLVIVESSRAKRRLLRQLARAVREVTEAPASGVTA